jgi:cytochrome c-type biogenesis protein CcmH/NrfG
MLRTAAKEDPRDVEVLGNLGFALLQAQQAPEAARALRPCGSRGNGRATANAP